MKNLKNMISEFHGQLEQFTKGMKSGKEKEIAERESNRKQVVDEFGIGDLSRGEGD